MQLHSCQSLLQHARHLRNPVWRNVAPPSRTITPRAMATAVAEAPASVDIKKSYEVVASKLKELSALQGIDGLLGWDQGWVEARKASDFSKFAPYLQEWVDVSKEKAVHINPAGAV
ncbi:uncharacterized protein HaLaN_01364 [Haematococcus lacustris]|uniref:Uncharacterized protein n=1 Tax=Haematococcus lacustris TaxID=44745 RepID=A0A699YIK1_HAELA|nr:uncharacterized protein HaLaN_01364 [Haematococcus lacustris]